MEKPVSIIIMEARKTIEDAIMSTQLEPSILSLILKDVCKEVEQASTAKLMADVTKYRQESAQNDTENKSKNEK